MEALSEVGGLGSFAFAGSTGIRSAENGEEVRGEGGIGEGDGSGPGW